MKLMTYVFKAAIALIFVLTPLSIHASDSFDKQINTLMKPWSSAQAPGVAIAVRVDGELAFAGGYGLANLEAGTPMTSTTPIRVASISKQFTAFAALLLVDAGKLSLDTDVHTLLPEMQIQQRPLLVRHLLDHVSGLRDESSLALMAGWQQDDAISQDQAVKLVTQQKGLNFKPETDYQYNNSNYLLLAEIVERVSGQSFSEFMQEHVFQPLRMTDTQFADDRFEVITGRAYSYFPTQTGFMNARFNSEVLGSAGLITTAQDLLLWAENFETKRVGSAKVHQWMAERATTLNGINAVHAKGQELRNYGGDALWCHGGRNGGFRSFLIRIPAQKLAISVLANRADFDMSQIAYDLLAIVHPTGGEHSDNSTMIATYDDTKLDEFAGDFRLFKGLVFSFKPTDGTLFFSTNQMDDWVPLKRVSEARFLLNEAANTYIEFNLDDDAAPSSIDYVLSKNGRLTAPRVVSPDLSTLNANLESYEGVYWSEELETRYTIELRDNRLYALHQRSAPIELFLSGKNAFDSRANNFMQIEFFTNKGEEVYGLKMSHAVANDVWFDRVDRD